MAKDIVVMDPSTPPNKSHDLRQPLNVISLSVANLRARLAPRLGAEDASYLNEKLDRIQQQVARAAEILDR